MTKCELVVSLLNNFIDDRENHYNRLVSSYLKIVDKSSYMYACGCQSVVSEFKDTLCSIEKVLQLVEEGRN